MKVKTSEGEPKRRNLLFQLLYSRGSQPVARGPKVARETSKSGPRPLKKLKLKYI